MPIERDENVSFVGPKMGIFGLKTAKMTGCYIEQTLPEAQRTQELSNL